MSQHTPGPWTVKKTETGSLWVQKGIAYSITLIGHENAENDARLIAAAPDLLAVLEDIAKDNCECEMDGDRNLVCDYHDPNGDVQMALVKARGYK